LARATTAIRTIAKAYLLFCTGCIPSPWDCNVREFATAMQGNVGPNWAHT
jgi:hypothetical protein